MGRTSGIITRVAAGFGYQPPPKQGLPDRSASLSKGRLRTGWSRRYGVFLVQDHPLMITGTTAFLNAQPDLFVEGAAREPMESLREIEKASPDIAVVEVALTGPFDFSFLKKLRKAFPDLPILAFSYHEEVIFARRAIEAGANGYLMKEAPPEKLGEALRQILSGRVYISDRVIARIERERRIREGSNQKNPPLNGSLVNSLNTRELQIFQLLGDGVERAGIQNRLEISGKALSSALYRIREKLGLRSNAELAQFATHFTYYEGDFS